MKNTVFLLFIIALVSCNSKQKNKTLPVQETEEEIEETVVDLDFEEALDEIAIGGNGIVFENGGMSFTAEVLETTFNEAEEQLNDIKTKYKYESEAVRQSAIKSMELNLDLFRGQFCCTTHDTKHCEDSKSLKTLEQKYSCNRFMKKK